MILSMLPPVGNKIILSGTGEIPEFSSYSPVWLDSGTSALALALILIREKSSDISEPKVLIPAYACPDLIAAAEFAKVKPVLVDICPSDPSFDLERLRENIDQSTVAVLAVNFLGIKERLSEIKAMLPSHTFLLEDNAQWYPEFEDQPSYGDFVITSFGRGKPASILGGGLLLVRKELNDTNIDELNIIEASELDRTKPPFSSTIKILIYNILLVPYIYFWLLKIPFIHIGETAFKALDVITEMPRWRKKLLGINLRRYLQNRSAALISQYQGLFASHSKFSVIANDNADRNNRMLRYPILCCSSDMRDRFFADLQRLGLGATKMYQRPLLEIDGVKARVDSNGENINAAGFARRLITLPVHEGVSERHVAMLTKLLERY